MLFNSAQFVVFFAVVLAVYRSLPGKLRGHWLLGCSLLFYLLWIPEYLLLLLADIGVNFALLRAMLRSPRPKLFLDHHGKSINFPQGISANGDNVRTWIAVSIKIRPESECVKNHIMIRFRYLRIDRARIDLSMAQE